MNNKYIAILIVLCAMIASCENKLEIPQKGVLPTESFYKTDEDCNEALTALYAQMKDLLQNQYSPAFVTNLLSDDCYSGASARLASDDKESLNEFRFDSSNPVIEDLFEGLYVTINRANLIINNYEEGTTNIQKRAVAEAKVFRAYCYFHLVTLFGPVPLITEAFRDDYKSSNSTTAELWQLVEDDLNDAINADILPIKAHIDDKVTGIRATNDFAKAMLGKVYVFEEKWSEAAKLLDEVVNCGRYGLLDDYTAYADAVNNNNREILFSDNKTNDPNNEGVFTTVLFGWSSNYFNGLGIGNECNMLGFGFGSPSATLVEAFAESEGEDGYRFTNTIKSYEQMLAMGVSVKPNSEVYAHCGYGYWKIRMSSKNLITGTILFIWSNDIVMRLGEVILLAAEAHIMLNDGQGDKYINMIRDKAHLPHLTNATLDDLKKEKRLELCMEGCRYQDLIRWGDASKVLKDQWRQVPNFAGLNDDGTYKVVYPSVNQNTTYGFKEGKHELLPIPLTEINVNPNIKQNPNW